MKAKVKRGPRKRIKGETQTKTFNITIDQADWIYDQAIVLDMSESEFVRDLLESVRREKNQLAVRS